MKTQFRIREEIRTENGEKISRFYCEHKFLWLWWDTFICYEGGDEEDEIGKRRLTYFNSKQEALTALRNEFQLSKPVEVKFHEVGSEGWD
jgi:hypothetical protein